MDKEWSQKKNKISMDKEDVHCTAQTFANSFILDVTGSVRLGEVYFKVWRG